MSWDKTEGGDFGHSSRSENFIRGLNIELTNERDRRAKAEAENERYKMMIESITGGLDECIETVQFLEAENARLRKVAEAVADLYSDWMEYGYMDSITSRSLITVFETWKALAELGEADYD